MKDSEIQFFKPLWRRLLLLATAILWCGIELAVGSQTWLLVALVLSVYIAWRYLISFPDDDVGK